MRSRRLKQRIMLPTKERQHTLERRSAEAELRETGAAQEEHAVGSDRGEGRAGVRTYCVRRRLPRRVTEIKPGRASDQQAERTGGESAGVGLRRSERRGSGSVEHSGAGAVPRRERRRCGTEAGSTEGSGTQFERSRSKRSSAEAEPAKGINPRNEGWFPERKRLPEASGVARRSGIDASLRRPGR